MRGKALKKNQVDWSVFFKAVVTIALPIALQVQPLAAGGMSRCAIR